VYFAFSYSGRECGRDVREHLGASSSKLTLSASSCVFGY
jgi:hypothetical protein